MCIKVPWTSCCPCETQWKMQNNWTSLPVNKLLISVLYGVPILVKVKIQCVKGKKGNPFGPISFQAKHKAVPNHQVKCILKFQMEINGIS